MPTNLFAKAKKTAAPKTTKAKDEKLRIKVKDADFFDKIERLEQLQENMKRDKASADLIHDEIKEIAKAEWSKVFDKTSKNPGSVMLESRRDLDVAQMMFVPSDKYISINEERAEYLVETYGEDAVEEKTSFSFDNEMVDKYGEVLSQLIWDCDDIDEDDKEKIIKATRSFSIKKGSIDKFKEFAEETDLKVLDIVEEFKPVVGLKNVEIIKG
jgi:hypothetical protein